MEELTGTCLEEVLGRNCWEVIGGTDLEGRAVCTPDCAYARCALQGCAVRRAGVLVETAWGRRRAGLSAVAVSGADPPPLLLHLIREVAELPSGA